MIQERRAFVRLDKSYTTASKPASSPMYQRGRSRHRRSSSRVGRELHRYRLINNMPERRWKRPNANFAHCSIAAADASWSVDALCLPDVPDERGRHVSSFYSDISDLWTIISTASS